MLLFKFKSSFYLTSPSFCIFSSKLRKGTSQDAGQMFTESVNDYSSYSKRRTYNITGNSLWEIAIAQPQRPCRM